MRWKPEQFRIRRRFAFLPRRLRDGTVVWLEPYQVVTRTPTKGRKFLVDGYRPTIFPLYLAADADAASEDRRLTEPPSGAILALLSERNPE